MIKNTWSPFFIHHMEASSVLQCIWLSPRDTRPLSEGGRQVDNPSGAAPVMPSSPFFVSLQSGSMCIWCLHQIWIFTANAQCRSLMRISISGISTMPRSNWWCGLSAPWGDTGGTPRGSPLSQEGKL